MKNILAEVISAFVLFTSFSALAENQTQAQNPTNAIPNSYGKSGKYAKAAKKKRCLAPIFHVTPRQFQLANIWIQTYYSQCQSDYRWRYDFERQSYITKFHGIQEGETYEFELLMDGAIRMDHTVVDGNNTTTNSGIIGFWTWEKR